MQPNCFISREPALIAWHKVFNIQPRPLKNTNHNNQQLSLIYPFISHVLGHPLHSVFQNVCRSDWCRDGIASSPGLPMFFNVAREKSGRPGWFCWRNGRGLARRAMECAIIALSPTRSVRYRRARRASALFFRLVMILPASYTDLPLLFNVQEKILEL